MQRNAKTSEKRASYPCQNTAGTDADFDVAQVSVATENRHCVGGFALAEPQVKKRWNIHHQTERHKGGSDKL